MTAWRPQHYRRLGKSKGIDPQTLDNAIAAGQAVIDVDPALPPIFTLRHLAHLTGVNYGLLRAIVERSNENPYKVFRIRKRPSESGERRYRTICAPEPALLIVQRWISTAVLRRGRTHSASTAYSKGSKLIAAAEPHCGCRWLIKLDVRNFFESISEVSAYRVFRGLGYQPLVAFELTRLSTRLGSSTLLRRRKRWRKHDSAEHMAIKSYQHGRMGHLPQGAPTSPMLANLAMVAFDEQLSALAARHDLTYTRYADDIALSTCQEDFTRDTAAKVIGQVYALMGKHGLSPNSTKTRVVPPGGRKVLLGLLVDGEAPRLTREFKSTLRMHLHFLRHPEIGPARHAARRGFAAVAGLRNHIEGLVSFAGQIEPEYAKARNAELITVRWPA
jgi:RNA-directed DNA polymerase